MFFNFILAGIGVILFYFDYGYSADFTARATGINQLIGGSLAIASAIVMLVDGLHTLKFF